MRTPLTGGGWSNENPEHRGAIIVQLAQGIMHVGNALVGAVSHAHKSFMRNRSYKDFGPRDLLMGTMDIFEKETM